MKQNRDSRHLISITFTMALSLWVGCADDPAATSPALALEFASGEYEVPTDDPALAGANIYPTTKVELGAVGAQYVLEYDLPEGLVGGELALEFTGPRLANGVYQLVGANGTADCTYVGGALLCHEIFTNLVIDHAAVTAYWSAQGLSGAGLLRRQEVSQLFDADPIGILRAGN